MNSVVSRDLERIYDALSVDERSSFKDSTVLFTGGAGFLGYYFISFFSSYKADLQIKKIICLDNFHIGKPKWLMDLSASGLVEVKDFNIISDAIENVPGAENADFVYHMASIASPLFYRRYPLETLDANVWGLRRLLDYYCEKNLKGLVFFSSSEIYGDPDPAHIPTDESYRGFVDCQGPRACYDESKRIGETLCYLYNKKYNMPITVIRPFNNYGPGMRLNDARVPADFANAVRQNNDIVMYSDGSPTRTFCYISDAVTGYIKALLYARKGFEAFNIGIDRPEISMARLAEIYKEKGQKVFGYSGSIVKGFSPDSEHRINNPQRRCPVIDKARKLLGYDPQVYVEEGVERFLEFIKESEEADLIW